MTHLVGCDGLDSQTSPADKRKDIKREASWRQGGSVQRTNQVERRQRTGKSGCLGSLATQHLMLWSPLIPYKVLVELTT